MAKTVTLCFMAMVLGSMTLAAKSASHTRSGMMRRAIPADGVITAKESDQKADSKGGEEGEIQQTTGAQKVEAKLSARVEVLSEGEVDMHETEISEHTHMEDTPRESADSRDLASFRDSGLRQEESDSGKQHEPPPLHKEESERFKMESGGTSTFPLYDLPPTSEVDLAPEEMEDSEDEELNSSTDHDTGTATSNFPEYEELPASEIDPEPEEMEGSEYEFRDMHMGNASEREDPNGDGKGGLKHSCAYQAFRASWAAVNDILGTTFCWRAAYDRGVGEPATCKKGWEQRGQMCYPECKNGFRHDGDIEYCQEHCPKDYTDWGLHCRRNGAGYGKGCCCTIFGCCNNCRAGYWDMGCTCEPEFRDQVRHYSPGKTKYDPQVIGCKDRFPDGPKQTPVGHYCYPPPDIGYECDLTACRMKCPPHLVECGHGACALDADSCAGTISEMVLETFSAIVSTAALIGTLGGSSGGSAAANSAKASGKVAVKEGVRGAVERGAYKALKPLKKSWAKLRTREGIREKAKQLSKKLVCTCAGQAVAGNNCITDMTDSFVEAIGTKFSEKTEDDFDQTGAYAEFDLKGVENGIETEASKYRQGVQDAKEALNIVSMVDPTGWVAVAAAFTHPMCSDTSDKSTLDGLEDNELGVSTKSSGDTPSKSCSIQYPYSIKKSGGKIPGLPWPAQAGSKEECGYKCEAEPRCKAFHYYGDRDRYSHARGACYMHKGGELDGPKTDGRDRYAGVCGSCTTPGGPSFSIKSSSGRARGVRWPEYTTTADGCRAKCEANPSCKAYHYYGDQDRAYRACYLHKSGSIDGPKGDGRDRYAGVCNK